MHRYRRRGGASLARRRSEEPRSHATGHRHAPESVFVAAGVRLARARAGDAAGDPGGPRGRRDCAVSSDRARRRAARSRRRHRPRSACCRATIFTSGSDGPKLIEINTNAGGAMLNAVMGRAQQACCREVADLISGPSDFATIEERLFAMFIADWRRARGHGAAAPHRDRRQRAAARSTCTRNSCCSSACSNRAASPRPSLIRRELDARWRRAAPRRADPIDMVYNRLTDFYFDAPEHAVLARAYRANAAVVTPHPHSHALYANKHNLALLSDAAVLHRWGIERSIADTTAASHSAHDARHARGRRRAVARPQAPVLQTRTRLRQRRRVSRRQSSREACSPKFSQATTSLRRWCHRASGSVPTAPARRC